ncbi:hypothetical protein OH492_15070 [Vibrio chagasii]|nr:hypothetical protein [Vibrio chagasii]
MSVTQMVISNPNQRQHCSMPSVSTVGIEPHEVIMRLRHGFGYGIWPQCGASNVGVLTGTAQHSELGASGGSAIASVAHFELNQLQESAKACHDRLQR